MKKFNLFKEIIVANREDLLNAIDSSKPFGISFKGAVCYEPFSSKEILIFQLACQSKPKDESTQSSQRLLESAFGNNYQIVLDSDRVLIKAFANWQEIIGWNTPRASYDDTTADGVDEFSTKEMEEIGWNATEFNIKYRDLVDVLEEKCDGTIICLEQEAPYMFSGLGFLESDKNAKEVLYHYCQAEIKKLIKENNDYQKENLEGDELEAAEFFKAI